MATYKEFAANNITTTTSFLNQLVDIVGADVSGSDTRRTYEVFVTGGLGPGVTSSLFQTVFDQNFTLQTANPIFDITFGFNTGSAMVIQSYTGIDANGKYLFPSNTLMMREKLDIYRLFARELLGDENAIFTTQAVGTATTNEVKEAVFICFKRLFSRDKIKRETFALRVFSSASLAPAAGENLASGTGSNPIQLTDIGGATNVQVAAGGQYVTVVNSANTSQALGQLFLDRGILVLDMSRSFDQARLVTGSIHAVTNTSGFEPNFSGSLCQLAMSASVDDFVDHLCTSRFTGSLDSVMTFQNITNINSTIFFCRAAADEFNYSSNPTYTDNNNRIVVIDPGQEIEQKAFTFVTSVGMYDANNNLLAVAKLSRPVYKDDERDLTVRVRLDF